MRIASDIAEALDHAHRHGVVHRDIKPANILLTDGRPVIADFGIALAVAQAGGGRVTETGLSVGTPHYMSPEQATGDPDVDPRSDVYALGCVLYEMLTGDPPYQGSTAQAVLAQILTADAVSATTKRVSVPPNVDAAIRKALEKLPADRFASAQELARALGDPGFRHGEAVATDATLGRGLWNPLSDANPHPRAVRFLRPILATFLLMGGRAQEVLGVLRADVDFRDELVHIRPNPYRRLKRTKHRRWVTLWPQLTEILTHYLDTHPRESRELLFPSPHGGMISDLRGSLSKAVRAAGIDKPVAYILSGTPSQLPGCKRSTTGPPSPYSRS